MSLYPSLDQVADVLAIGGFLFSVSKMLLRRRSVGRLALTQREIRRLHALFQGVAAAREDAVEREIALATALSLEIRGCIFGAAALGFLGLGVVSCEIMSLPVIAPLTRLLTLTVSFLLLAGGHWTSQLANEVQTRGNDIRLAFAGTNSALEVVHERLARLEYRHPRLAYEVQAVRTLDERSRRPTGIAWSWDGKEPSLSARGPVRQSALSSSGYEVMPSNSTLA